MNITTIPDFLIESTIPGYNWIINGEFYQWIRGTSQSAPGYGSDDRWFNGNIGSTKIHSQQSFGYGSVFPDGEPLPGSNKFSRTVVTSVTNAANIVYKSQRIEDVTKLANKKVTLSFYAKADSNKNICIEFYQDFGTGGTPSTQVAGISSTTVALTTTWKKYTITITLPSVNGKVLGTNGNDHTGVVFWFDAGSNYSARTNNLGQQSGTFDIAKVALVEGDIYEPVIWKDAIAEELLCNRYMEMQYYSFAKMSQIGTYAGVLFDKKFKTPKRIIPSMSFYVGSVGNSPGYCNINGNPVVITSSYLNAAAISKHSYRMWAGSSVIGNQQVSGIVLFDAEI